MWKSFASGGFAGIGIIVSGHPLDTIKVRLQTQKIEAGKAPMYSGMVDCFQKTVRNEGPLGLYKGMATPLIGYTPMWALCFFGYEAGQKMQGKVVGEMNYAEIGLAGGTAGFYTTMVMAPAERIKTLLQVQSGVTKLYNGPIDVIRKVGLRGTFQGTLATLYRDVPASAAYFTAYEATKNLLRNKEGAVSTGGLLMAGGMAGVMNWVVSLPMDVVKSRVQSAASGSPESNFGFALKSLLKNEGPLALYRGFAPVMARAFPCNAIGFVMYDFAKRTLDEKFPEN